MLLEHGMTELLDMQSIDELCALCGALGISVRQLSFVVARLAQRRAADVSTAPPPTSGRSHAF